MALIKRLVKGSPLTFAEGDANLDYLENLALSGSGGSIETGSFATTSSNSFYGNQIISGTSDFILGIHGVDDNPWAFGIYNDTYNPTQAALAGFIWSDGKAAIGTEVNTELGIYTNANYYNPTLIISSSGVTINNTVSLSTGDVIITKNLYVQGTASIQEIQYVSQSVLNIGTNLITVNTATPTTRFGGLAVFDSGSTGLTGSLLWDSENNNWVYTNPSGGLYDGALVLMGPRNTSGTGNEEGINPWYAALGNGGHHMTSSQIYNSGSLIRLETNTEVTGSLIISSGITGSLQGTASYATTSSYALTGIPSTNIGEKLYTFYNFY